MFPMPIRDLLVGSRRRHHRMVVGGAREKLQPVRQAFGAESAWYAQRRQSAQARDAVGRMLVDLAAATSTAASASGARGRTRQRTRHGVAARRREDIEVV